MDEEKFSPLDAVTDLVRKSGKRVDRGSAYCKQFVATHENCLECESKEGCDAVVQIGIVMMYPILYKPTSFKEFLEQEAWIKDKLKKILDGEKVDL